MTKTNEIMTANAVTRRHDEPMSAAAERMWEHDIGALPVTDEHGRAIAMITDRDIAMAAYTQGRPLSEIPVSSAMSNNLQAVRADTPLSDVERVMQRSRIRRIPVVDDAGRPIGVVSLNDLARSTSGRSARVRPDELSATLRAICEPHPRTPHMAAG